MNENTLGGRILELLKINDMTQRELADIVGITEVSMCRYVKGERTPKGPVIANIANALHTTSDHLLGTEEVDDFESEYYRIHRLIARNASKMSSSQKRELVNALFESDDQEG
jgi:transcriptional regulator with XRE-family HTH domain